MPPNDWRDAGGALVSAPNYGWIQGGGLPATWWTTLNGNDSASVNSQDFVSSRQTGGFIGGTGGNPADYVLDEPTALTVGNRSYLDWSVANNPVTSAHNADFGLFSLSSAADVTITVEGLAVGSGDLIGAGTGDLRPGLTIWSGWDSAGAAGHRPIGVGKNGAPAPGFSYAGEQFFSVESISLGGAIRPTDTLAALASGTDYSSISTSGSSELGTGVTAFNRNAAGSASLTLSNLAAGNYTIVIGGFCGRAGNVSTGTLQCSTGGGSSTQQYKVSFSSVSAVPAPAAAWLFGPALAWLSVIGRRKRNTTS